MIMTKTSADMAEAEQIETFEELYKQKVEEISKAEKNWKNKLDSIEKEVQEQNK
jgi:hypothetical protein